MPSKNHTFYCLVLSPNFLYIFWYLIKLHHDRRLWTTESLRIQNNSLTASFDWRNILISFICIATFSTLHTLRLDWKTKKSPNISQVVFVVLSFSLVLFFLINYELNLEQDIYFFHNFYIKKTTKLPYESYQKNNQLHFYNMNKKTTFRHNFLSPTKTISLSTNPQSWRLIILRIANRQNQLRNRHTSTISKVKTKRHTNDLRILRTNVVACIDRTDISLSIYPSPPFYEHFDEHLSWATREAQECTLVTWPTKSRKSNWTKSSRDSAN